MQWCNRNVFIKFYFIGILISSISLQQEISAMVKQKCFYKVLFHRNSDIFYFCAVRNQCNGETEIFRFEEVLLQRNSDIFFSLQQEFSAMVKQKCFYKVLFHRNSDIFYFSVTRNQCNGETEISF